MRPTAPIPPPGPTELRLTLWVDAACAWHARAEWGPEGGREQRAFDSPLELARFVAQLPRAAPPAGPGGLR